MKPKKCNEFLFFFCTNVEKAAPTFNHEVILPDYLADAFTYVERVCVRVSACVCACASECVRVCLCEGEKRGA